MDNLKDALFKELDDQFYRLENEQFEYGIEHAMILGAVDSLKTVIESAGLDAEYAEHFKGKSRYISVTA